VKRRDDTRPSRAGEKLGLRVRRVLYVAGGSAAVIAALLFRRNLAAEFVLLRELGVIGSGPIRAPGSAGEWFALLAQNRLVGLTLFNIFDLVNYALLGVMFLAQSAALCAALRRTNRGLVLVAAALGLIAVVIAFASSRAFAMRSLGQRYATAGTETERALLLTQGERLLSVENPGALYPGAGPTVALFLVTLAALMISIAMLRSPTFSRPTAYLGLAAEGLQMGYFVALALAPTPALLAIPPATAAPFRLVWYLLIGRRLLQLAAREDTDPGKGSN
jgi:hypothetical protein